jgi:hypothetical protein
MGTRVLMATLVLLLSGCTSRIGGIVVSTAQVSDGRMLVRTCDLVQGTVLSAAAGFIAFGSGNFAFENCRWAPVHVLTPAQAESYAASVADDSGPSP